MPPMSQHASGSCDSGPRTAVTQTSKSVPASPVSVRAADAGIITLKLEQQPPRGVRRRKRLVPLLSRGYAPVDAPPP
ncbi:hypothetical protein INR49_002612 [Caranx melampygus]|nr:hypothetical protein INR49_002612 [Caranx melampygus]